MNVDAEGVGRRLLEPRVASFWPKAPSCLGCGDSLRGSELAASDRATSLQPVWYWVARPLHFLWLPLSTLSLIRRASGRQRAALSEEGKPLMLIGEVAGVSGVDS